MKVFKLGNFIRGWVVGDFEPNILKTREFEFGLKSYKKGYDEKGHMHKLASEVNIITAGKFEMDGQILSKGDIIRLYPGESFSRLKCLEDGDIAVVKTPSVVGDKYPLGEGAPKEKQDDRVLNIVVPMAGKGARFQEAGYTFPKPLIDINGKTMIEVVVNNLKPRCKHKFIFICQKQQCEKYDIYNILKRATDDNFEIIKISGVTQGAACTVLCAVQHINNENDLLIANSDQLVEADINNFIKDGRQGEKDGLIMTFYSNHPKWSYTRVDKDGKVQEAAEKKVISNDATVGIYYFGKGSDFVKSAQSMVEKNIRYNNEFYVCPVYNEMILDDKNVYIHSISEQQMHGLGTPEDLKKFLEKLNNGEVKI